MPAPLNIEQLYRTHGRSVRRRARAILGNDAEANEVLQDVFASLVSQPAQLDGVRSPTAFLYGATTHRCLNLIRNSKNRLRLLQENTTVDERDDTKNPETRSVAKSVLASLDETSAKAAVYYYVDEMSHAEIATMLDCSRRHVGNLLQRVAASVDRSEPASC